MQEFRYRPDHVDLQVVTAGSEGPAVLFLPGFGGGAADYRPFVEALAHGHRVIGVSPRGFGTSGWSAPYAISDWVDDVVAVARDLADAPVVAVGHSFGAYLALGAAAQDPSRFRAVVSLDQLLDLDVFAELVRSIFGYWQQIRAAVVAGAGDVAALSEALADTTGLSGTRLGDELDANELDRIARKWSVQDPRVLDALNDDDYGEWIADRSLADLPSQLDLPLLCVDGDPSHGSIVSEESAQRVRGLYRQVRQVRLDGVGHQLGLLEEPGRVVDEIASFIAHVP